MKVEQLGTILPNKEKTLSEIALFIKNRSEEQPNFSLLMGAGTSISSGVNSGQELVKEWRREFFLNYNSAHLTTYTPESAKNFLIEKCSEWYNPEKEYSSFFERKFDLPAQRRVFIEGEVKNAKPSLGYAYLTQFVNENYFNTVFTTNFDDLINEAFYRFGEKRPLVCAHDSSVKDILITARRPKIIKLHGDYLFDDLKCTKDDTSTLNFNMKEKFEQFLREYGLIVLGYSAGDDSIMALLEKMIKEDNFLRNGLYWCFRKNSGVSPRLIEILKNNKAYYIIIDGFDEFFAELHSTIIGHELFLGSWEMLSKIPDLIKHWLDNRHVYSESNMLIQNQLNSLEESSRKGKLGNTLADLYSDEKNPYTNLNDLDDFETFELLTLTRLRKQCKYEELIIKAKKLISESENNEFKKHLLIICYKANRMLNRFQESIEDCKKIITLDENNPAHQLRLATAESDYELKLRAVDDAIKIDKYHWAAHHTKAELLLECLEIGIKIRDDEILEEIKNSLNISVQRRPGLSNPSWKRKIDLLLEYHSKSDKNRNIENAKIIIEKLQEQDKYSPIIAELLYKVCKAENTEMGSDHKNYKQFLWDSLTKYNPKCEPELFKWFVEYAKEFGDKDIAREAHSHFETHGNNVNHCDSFVLANANMRINLFQDVDGAIAVLEQYLETGENVELISTLIRFYLYRENLHAAKMLFLKHKNSYSRKEQVKIESEILVAEGNIGSAIRLYEPMLSEPYFLVKNSTTLTYLHLKNQDYRKAKKMSEDLLNQYKWSRDQMAALIINHDFAMKKLSKKPNKQRLSELLEFNSDKDIKAMAYLLLGEEDKCLDIMKRQALKNFSKVFEYKSWPITETVIARFNREMDLNQETLEIISSK